MHIVVIVKLGASVIKQQFKKYKDLYNFKTICTIVTKLLKNCIIFFSRFDLIMLHKNFSQNLCIHTSIHTEHLCSFFQQ